MLSRSAAPEGASRPPIWPGGVFAPVYRILQFFASLQLAVFLIVVLAAVLAWATFLEAGRGTESAHWYVYSSPWFLALLALLAANILAATLVRFPWKLRQIGFLVTHAGLLVLLAGAMATFLGGTEGQLVCVEGETADSIFTTDRSQIATDCPAAQGRVKTEFSFLAGPDDWGPGQSLDFGEADGIGLRVLKFHRHARVKTEWVADKSARGGPAIQFAVYGPDGALVTEQFLAADQFGGVAELGPVSFQLFTTSTPSMLKDFLERPAELGEDGVLSMHYEGNTYRIPVKENLGKKVPVGNSGIQVELAEYLPNARPGQNGRFVSVGNEPDNPLLELLVYLPGQEKPMRQIAFAALPMLSLDGIHGWQCPVKFWFHHPRVTLHAGVQFLQTPDGKLYARVADGGGYQPRGEVKAGARIEMGGQFRLTLLKHVPYAIRQVTFQPVETAPNDSQSPEAAALVEVTVDGAQRQVWLKRNDDEHGVESLPTPRGPMMVAFGYERQALGFGLKLLDFKRQLNPGRMGYAGFSSTVQVVTPIRSAAKRYEISMNQPLVFGGYSFYQSDFQELPDGREVSILTVSYDPGRLLKYSGSLMICVGIFIMFYLKASSRGKAGAAGRAPAAGGEQPHQGAAATDIGPAEAALRRTS